MFFCIPVPLRRCFLFLSSVSANPLRDSSRFLRTELEAAAHILDGEKPMEDRKPGAGDFAFLL